MQKKDFINSNKRETQLIDKTSKANDNLRRSI